MQDLRIREAQPGDEGRLAAMMLALWPDGSTDEHRAEAESLISTRMCGTLPGTFFVAVEANETLRGFIQVGLRSHADGCDVTRPVGFIEGWFVDASFRGQGLGRRLMQAAEEWSRELKCREIASDALIDNAESQSAHRAVGFEVVDRCVHFRKQL
jgi:aminoglycoside 6'-N-acetyltransferase I